MASDKFRQQLRHEMEIWRSEGIIQDSQYEQLSQRYQLDTLDTTSRDRFVTILIGLGSILIGLGVITFVAANWQALSRTTRVALLLSLFISVNIAGFYLWRKQNAASQRLGQGLLILGALILGANMGLMGQMFHITSPFYELLFAWGIGVIAMAYSLQVPSLGVMSILLIWSGYWGLFTNNLFTLSSQNQAISWSSLLGQHLPILACIMFIPLAYWCRSQWIFALGAIAIFSSLLGNIISYSVGVFNLTSLQATGWILTLAFALPPALLWSYDDSLWVHSNFFGRGVAPKSFVAIARNLAIAYLAIVFYICSFYGLWDNWSSQTVNNGDRLNWFPLIDVLVLAVVAIWQWLYIIRQRRSHSGDLTTSVVAVLCAIAALIPLWHSYITQIPIAATFIFNTLLFLLATGLIREGLAQGQRRAFWGGMLLLTLRIATWVLRSVTALIFKSLILVLCGVAIIAIGLWFERYVKTFSNTH